MAHYPRVLLVRLSDRQRADVEALARQRDVSVSELVRSLVVREREEWLRDEGRRTVKPVAE